MKFEGTPGPWHWEGNVLGNKDVIAGGRDWVFSDKDKALIAAPELLDALQAMLNKAYKQNWNEQYPDEISAARAAIAKAIGKEE